MSSDSLPWPEVADVIAIHAAFAVAVQVQSRLVEIASVPDIPSAGAALVAAFWTVTSHLAAVGAVTDMAEDDPVHALESHPSAQSANSRSRIARVQNASSLPRAASSAVGQPSSFCDHRQMPPRHRRLAEGPVIWAADRGPLPWPSSLRVRLGTWAPTRMLSGNAHC